MTSLAEPGPARPTGQPRFYNSTIAVLGTLIAAASLAALIVSTFIASGQTADLVRQGVAQRTQLVASSLARQAGAPVKFANREHLDSIAAQFAEGSSAAGGAVSGLLIVGAGGTVLVDHIGPGFDKAVADRVLNEAVRTQRRQQSADGLVVAEPVTFGQSGQWVGTVLAALSAERELAAAQTQFHRSLIFPVVVFLTAQLLAALAAWLYLSRPLAQIAGALGQIARG